MTNENTLDRPRAAKSAARRKHLLDTARNLFVERGFHQTGMAQIAAASGIAVGQIYRDFANKEAIIAAICESEITAWLDEETLGAAVAANDRDAILAWIERVGLEEPDCEDRRLMCELLAEAGRNPAINQMHVKVDSRLRESLGAALGSLAPSAAAQRHSTVADFIIAMSWGMVALRELSPGSDHETLHSRLAQLLRQEVIALEA
ncbi:TetR/AcrR family transcriptional regulator [Novosphingobium guangzhouense]|uniref:TetR family transcriptional regulator n=1 Tax=Novosphingobium guangzhouense TaxID=1850347 RepID=A0A2K2FUX4_9SPHN|nr:TetR/AcrR family transcriptional regulator [Novosphingobium guangzhouense]PNU02583.1 TetR family transcriptional regulator [Novosphingobium guangzhouense]